jgi:hypothetical protein
MMADVCFLDEKGADLVEMMDLGRREGLGQGIGA